MSAMPALGQHEQELAGLQNLAFADYPDGLLLVDTDTFVIRAANRQACAMLGYDEAELVRLEIGVLESSIEGMFFWEEIRTGHFHDVEMQQGAYLHKAGHVISVVKRISQLVYQGKRLMLVNFRDNVDRRTIEEALQRSTSLLTATLESTADGILVVSVDGSISNMNQRFAQMWRIPQALVELGQDELIFDFLRQEAANSLEYAATLANTMQNTDVETQDVVRLTEDRFFERHTTPLLIDDIFSGFVFCFRDVTQRMRADEEQKKYEATLRTKNAELEKANLVKSEFLANMSHEIRTPMNAIIGMARLCLGTELTPQQRDYVEKLHRAGKSLLGIINDILDFSKIEAGKLALETTPFSLNQVFEHLTNLTSAAARDKGLGLTIHRDFPADQPTLERELVGDPLRLGQILLNLVGNAIKFTEQGSVHVAVQATAIKSDEIELHFSVADTGIGMNQEQCARLFQSFSQADASTTRKYGGTGLGLTISKSLVEMMHGHIQVNSEPGQGTTFVFTARFGRQAMPMAAVASTDTFSGIAVQDALHGLVVLVVEDNLINQQIAYEFLAQAGMAPIIANHGGECLDILASQAVDVVLMDVQMPVMDGYEATRRIRAQACFDALPVIAMTANAMVGDAERCIESGMNAHVGKPVDPDQLFATLRKWTSQRHTHGHVAR